MDLYRRITANVAKAGIRPQDVFITLVGNALDNWSVGNGHAQLVERGSVPGLTNQVLARARILIQYSPIHPPGRGSLIDRTH